MGNDGALVLGSCVQDACEELKSGLRYNEGNGDGMILVKDQASLVMSPAQGKLSEGTALHTVKCASGGKESSIEECATQTYAQWDVPPMFTIETGKKAVNCAPYSHRNPDEHKPIVADSRLVAQEACAKDRACKVYMWAGERAEEDANKAWLCEALD